MRLKIIGIIYRVLGRYFKEIVRIFSINSNSEISVFGLHLTVDQYEGQKMDMYKNVENRKKNIYRMDS